MAKSSTERNKAYIARNKAKGMKEWRVWVTVLEKAFLKEKLKEYRSKKGDQ